MDEKNARYLADELLSIYLDRMIEERLISRYEFEFFQDSPLIVIICYFNYRPSGSKKNFRGSLKSKELYCKIHMTVFKNFKHDSRPFFVSDRTEFDYFKNKILDKIISRNKAHDLENRVFGVLKKMVQDNHKHGVRQVHEGSSHTDNNLKLDIVFTVEVNMPAVFFQDRRETYQLGVNVKSSKGGQEHHKIKNLNKPSLYVSDSDTDEDIEAKIGLIIQNSLILLHASFVGYLISRHNVAYAKGLPLYDLINTSKHLIHQ